MFAFIKPRVDLGANKPYINGDFFPTASKQSGRSDHIGNLQYEIFYI